MASEGPNYNGGTFSHYDPQNTHWSNWIVNLSGQDRSCKGMRPMGGASFSIPAGSTIDGIKCEVKASDGQYYGAPPASLYYMFVNKTTTAYAGYAYRSITLTSTATWYSWGDSSQLWGTTWTVSEVNSTNFGCGFDAKGNHGYLVAGNITGSDERITVWYTPPPPTPPKIYSYRRLWQGGA